MISGVTFFSFREENPNKQTRSVLVEKENKKEGFYITGGTATYTHAVTGTTMTYTTIASGATNLYTLFNYGR